MTDKEDIMIRTAILACALLAIPSAALAQSQVVLPEVRMQRLPAAAPADGPPAAYITDVAPEYNGWIYQAVDGGGNATPPVTTTLYRGDGYPATIMVCPQAAPVRLLSPGQGDVTVRNNRCATVTTDHLRIATFGTGTTALQIRYRILAVHRAAD
jgi:hypothetical protein